MLVTSEMDEMRGRCSQPQAMENDSSKHTIEISKVTRIRNT